MMTRQDRDLAGPPGRETDAAVRRTDDPDGERVGGELGASYFPGSPGRWRKRVANRSRKSPRASLSGREAWRRSRRSRRPSGGLPQPSRLARPEPRPEPRLPRMRRVLRPRRPRGQPSWPRATRGSTTRRAWISLTISRKSFIISIIKLSAAGDTLENMVFGTGLGHRLRPLAGAAQPAGPERRHLSSQGRFSSPEGATTSRESLLEAFPQPQGFGTLAVAPRRSHERRARRSSSGRAYRLMAEKVWAVRPETHIVTHGYAHPIPDGRGVFNFPFGFHFIGPWLKPAFCREGHPRPGHRPGDLSPS